MITKEVFGTTRDGRSVELYTLHSGQYSASVSTYGGALTAFNGPDRNGKIDNVLLSYGKLSEYEHANTYFGFTVGRFANRIAHGRFSLDGKNYQLEQNDGGKHTLHSGSSGFSSHLFSATIDESSLVLTLNSPDGEGGFPGNVAVRVIFSLSSDGALRIDYLATSDRRTPLNLTNHAYFNLAGSGSILDHRLTLSCDRYLEVDKELIPTGTVLSCKGTAFDFMSPKEIGRDLEAAGGYDHCMIRAGAADLSQPVAMVEDPVSKRRLETFTTLEALQFYSGNFLDGTDLSAQGVPYTKHSGFCLETQHYPDSVNHPEFPSPWCDEEHPFAHTTIYRLSV